MAVVFGMGWRHAMGIPPVNAKNVRYELESLLPIIVPETKAFDEYAIRDDGR